MSGPIPTVNPGQLIKAEVINSLIEAHNDLLNRVIKLEQSSPAGDTTVVISGTIPQNSVQVGEELTVLGRNFGFKIGAERVFLGTTRIDAFKSGSDDDKLIFDVPRFTDIPAGGKPTTLTISNGTSSDTWQITIRPLEIPPGSWVNIQHREPFATPQKPVPSQPLLLHYSIGDANSPAASYAISATITDVSGQISKAAWQQNVTILDDHSKLLPPGTKLPVGEGQEKDFYVRIDPIPDGTLNTIVSFNVYADGGNIVGSYSETLTVGEAAVVTDDTIHIEPTFSSPDAETLSSDKSTIQLKKEEQTIIDFSILFEREGTYEVSVEIGASTKNWLVQLANVPNLIPEKTKGEYTVQANELHKPKLIVKPLSDASQTGQLVFRVKLKDAQKSQFHSFVLQLMS